MGTSDYLEEDVEDALVGGIEALHGLCWKLKMPWFTGVPDRMVLLPGGRIIFVELKKPKGRKSKRQGVVHETLIALGFRVEVLWTLEAVTNFLITL
jgi:hypothetical protein